MSLWHPTRADWTNLAISDYKANKPTNSALILHGSAGSLECLLSAGVLTIDIIASFIETNIASKTQARLFDVDWHKSTSAKVLDSSSLSVAKAAAIMDDADLSGTRAGAILNSSNLSPSRTISILNTMTTLNKLIGNVFWSEDFTTLWTTEEISDPEGNASVTVTKDTTVVFRDVPRSMKYSHTDGGAPYASVESAYNSVSLPVGTKAVLYFPIRIAAASSTYGNVKIIITYKDTAGTTRTIQYILRKGTTWQDPVTTDITVDLSNVPLGTWYVLARDFLADTSAYPPSTITEIRIRTGEYNTTLTLYACGFLLVGE